MSFNLDVAKGYSNPSQITRVLTETWANNELYCPNCGELHLDKSQANTPVTDFFCDNCKENYELKSQKDKFGRKINDGAYKTMMMKLNENNVPNLFLLNYDAKHYEVVNFVAVPKQFFVPSLIEKRKPLSNTAERHGWVGCNILLSEIPNSGKIFFVKDGIITPKKNVLNNWKKVLFLKQETDMSTKGWLLDIMACIDKLGKPSFTLDEMYEFENQLRQKHPTNRHIKDKIRQQLQILRDKNYLRFTERGKYTVN